MTTTKAKADLINGVTHLRILIQHPMDTGRQRDPATGEILPARYIRRLTVHHNNRKIIEAQLSTAVSRDPYLSFQLNGASAGDRIRIDWEDNLGRTDQQETLVRRKDGP